MSQYAGERYMHFYTVLSISIGNFYPCNSIPFVENRQSTVHEKQIKLCSIFEHEHD
jgi:hypothetical protein